MTTEPTELHDRVAEELYYEQHPEGRRRNDWRTEHPVTRYEFLDRAAAVLPIVAVEVRKAKAEALREAAGDIVWSAETLPHMTPHDAARGLVRRATEYETGDSDEHR